MLNLDEIFAVKKQEVILPRLSLVYAQPGTGKSPAISSLSAFNPAKGQIKSLAKTAEEYGYMCITFDLENPAGCSGFDNRSVHLPSKLAFEKWMDSYGDHVIESVIALAMTKKNVLLKMDGTHVKDDFNLAKLRALDNSDNEASRSLADHLWGQLEVFKNNHMTPDEHKSVYKIQIAVFDVFSKVLDWCKEWAATRYKDRMKDKKSSFTGDDIFEMSEARMSWHLYRQEINRKIEELSIIFPHLVLVFHSREKYNKAGAELSNEVVGREIAIDGASSETILRKCDVSMMLSRNSEGQLIATLRTEGGADAKTRLSHLWDLPLVKGQMPLDWLKIFPFDKISISK